MRKMGVATCFLLLGFGLYGQNAVTDWATLVQPAVVATAPGPPSNIILYTVIELAVYDAAVAIEGGHKPFAAAIPAPPGADIRAAVATAAWRTARTRLAPSQQPYLDTTYSAYLAGIPAGPERDAGVQVGSKPPPQWLPPGLTMASERFCPTSAAQCRLRSESSSRTAGAVPSQSAST